MVDRAIEQVAVVADDHDRVRVRAQVGFEPERAFEIEIVRRLVEQQDVRFQKEDRGERHAHPPATGEFPARARLGFLVETEASEDLRGPRGGRMGIDIAEPLVDSGNAMRIGCGLGLGEKRCALQILGEHPPDECLRPTRRLLRDMADFQSALDGDRSIVRREIADDELEECRLAGTVAPDEADLVA